MAAPNEKPPGELAEPEPFQASAWPRNMLSRSFRSPDYASPAETYSQFQDESLPAADIATEASLHSNKRGLSEELQGTALGSSDEGCGCVRNSIGGVDGEVGIFPTRERSLWGERASANARDKDDNVDSVDDSLPVYFESSRLPPGPGKREKGCKQKCRVSMVTEVPLENEGRIERDYTSNLDVAKRALEEQQQHAQSPSAPSSLKRLEITDGSVVSTIAESETMPGPEEQNVSSVGRGEDRRESALPRTGSERPILPSSSSSSLPSREASLSLPQPTCSPSDETGCHGCGSGCNTRRLRDGSGGSMEAAAIISEKEGGGIGLGQGSPSSSARGSGSKGIVEVGGVLPRGKVDAFDERLRSDGVVAVRPDVVGVHSGDFGILPLAGGGIGGGNNGHISGGRIDGETNGGRGCYGREGNGDFTLSRTMTGPVSVYSQALHMAVAFIVLMLVAFAKSEDGAVASGSSYGGVRTGAYGDPSMRRSSGVGGKKQRRRSSSGGREIGAPLVQRSPLLRWLRALWSKQWHRVEDDLATRWQAAGQALASLRKAWAALWVPRPHPEADVLAEALALSSRYSREDEDRWLWRATAEAVGAGSTGGSEQRWRKGSSKSGRRGWRNESRRRVHGGIQEASDGEIRLRRPVGLNCLSFLSLCGYRHAAGQGGGGRSRSPQFLLLLDLDETLVHCSPRLVEPRFSFLKPDLKLEMRGGAPSDRPASMYVWKRPHLDVFLSVASRWFEIALFTSARQCFAEPLVDLIDSQCVIGKRFYRDSCVRRDGRRATDMGNVTGSIVRDASVPTGGGAGVGPGSSLDNLKDLTVVESKHFPLRTVLVDNQPKGVVQQANVLPVRSWFPRDTEDRQLLDLLPVLLALTSCHDVRSVLGLRPGAGISKSEALPR